MAVRAVSSSRADRSFRSWLDRYDLIELIDPGRFYPTNRHAAQAFRQSPESATTKPDSGAVDKGLGQKVIAS